jgi:hypothetical protein
LDCGDSDRVDECIWLVRAMDAAAVDASATLQCVITHQTYALMLWIAANMDVI